MTTTTIETKIDRKLIVTSFGYGVDLDVHDTADNKRVFSVLSNEQATELATALLGENATVITDLPKAKLRHGFVEAGDIDRHASSDPADVLNHAKELLAIHKFLVEQQAVAAKEAEVAKAKEAELAARRDALAAEFRGWGNYGGSSETFQKAIDRIIELEEAAK